MNEETTIVDETIAQEEPQVEETEVVEEEAPEQTPEEIEKEKYSKRVQRRIDEFRKKTTLAEIERDEERKRRYILEQELEQVKTGKQQKHAESQSNYPKPEDFAAGIYDPEYLMAVTDYKIQQSIDNLQKSAKVNEQRNIVELQQEQARQKYNDYDDATSELLDHPIANDPVFNDAILNSDNVAEVAYFLGKNPDKLDDLAAMAKNPAKMLKYIGRIEAIIEQSKPLEQTKKPVSNAPKPVSLVGSAKPSQAVKNPETMSMDEYAAWRKGQK